MVSVSIPDVGPWSYSSISLFNQCPKKYYHLRVAKDVQDSPGEAALYGTMVHEAAENFIKHGEPIPDKFEKLKPIVETLAAAPGKKHAEIKLGVKRDEEGAYLAAPFFGSDTWYRGVCDLLVVNGDRALMVDYKTGKSARYADTKQLDLMAGAVFVANPEIQKIKSSLIFVVSGEFVKKTHIAERKEEYLSVFDKELMRLGAAMDNDVWNAKPSGLCPWCPVTSCSHWSERRR